MARRVTVETRTVGQSFGTVGVVRDMRGRKIAESPTVRPFGFSEQACRDALAIVEARGWAVVSKA